jgi:hypothetical protein
MKRKMSHKFTVLMIALAVLSLSACSKEEPVDDNSGYTEKLDEEPTAPDHDIEKTASGFYEASWVIDREVVDTTTIFVDKQKVRIYHMPTEYLLAPLLTDEQKGLAITYGPVDWWYTQQGYSWTNSYAITTPIYNYFDINIGEDTYNVALMSSCYMKYDKTKDVLTVTWSTQHVTLRQTSYPIDAEITSWTFDLAMTILLITTKHL